MHAAGRCGGWRGRGGEGAADAARAQERREGRPLHVVHKKGTGVRNDLLERAVTMRFSAAQASMYDGHTRIAICN